ncbi:NADP-dependent oxidoreductase domain-containing protein, partial [Epithele typhae]|uniref:NADP-dependent oxidoreductase domain-containing protein n=1 Tax=Epithele typhae TaxID=378194 RepID=UPI0020086E0E
VRVSPICLAAMSIATSGEGHRELHGQGHELRSPRHLLRRRGNFIDTANNYQDESSEEFIGEWMEARGIRDQIVLATKVRWGRAIRYQLMDARHSTRPTSRGARRRCAEDQYIGNNRKSMHLSVNASLKKLRTSYVDILYV